MIILHLMLFFGVTLAKVCKLDFLSSYGLEGEIMPQVRSMLLCPAIKFSCCTVFDELKFHKSWFGYYEEKLKASHNKAVAFYERLVEPVTYFRNFDWTNKESLVDREKLGHTKDILFKLEKIQLDSQLRPLTNDLEALKEFEIKTKKGFVCLLCDYNNHEYMSAKHGTIMVDKQFCNRLVDTYGSFLKKRAKLLNPVLLLAYKVMGNFAMPYFLKKDIESLKNVVKHKKAVEKCLPNENATYNYDNCKDLCNKYSASSLSPVFYGEFGFYVRFLHRYKKFREWIDSATEAVEGEGAESEKKEGEAEASPAEKKAGRLLEASNGGINRKIYKISRSLNDYKKVIRNLRRYNNGYLKKIYKNSKQLEQKSRDLGTNDQFIDYGNIYGLYSRNLQLNGQPLQQPVVQSPPALNTGLVNQPVPPPIPQTPQIPQLNGQLIPVVNNPAPPVVQPTPPPYTIDNDASIGNKNCTLSSEATNCVDSIRVKKSTGVRSSSNVTNSFEIALSANITNSRDLANVTNADNSFNVKDSATVVNSSRSNNVFNVTNCINCQNVTNAVNCTNCKNCTNVSNCVNCSNVFNVTDGLMLQNVTNSVNVTMVSDGDFLLNVEDSKNVTYVTNATNMTNAANCTECKHNFDCIGKACMMPKFSSIDMKKTIEDLIYRHSEKIIDRLYSLFRFGGIENYKSDPDAFDPQIFRSASLYNDLDRLVYIFDNEGAQLENDIGANFKDKTNVDGVKLAALGELLIEKNTNDLILVEKKKSDEFREKISAMTDFDLVYGFIRDASRGVMSYDHIRTKLDSELQTEEEEDKKITANIEGEEDTELEPAHAEAEARKLMHVLKHHHKIKRTIN